MCYFDTSQYPQNSWNGILKVYFSGIDVTLSSKRYSSKRFFKNLSTKHAYV